MPTVNKRITAQQKADALLSLNGITAHLSILMAWLPQDLDLAMAMRSLQNASTTIETITPRAAKGRHKKAAE